MPFERSTIETGGLPGFTFYPHVGSVRIDGPFNAAGAADTPTRRKIFVCHPTTKAQEDACAQKIVSTLAAQAFRRTPSPDDLRDLMALYHAMRIKVNKCKQGL